MPAVHTLSLAVLLRLLRRTESHFSQEIYVFVNIIVNNRNNNLRQSCAVLHLNRQNAPKDEITRGAKKYAEGGHKTEAG